MDFPQLDKLPGKWSGASRLFHEKDVYDSESTANIQYVGQRQFFSISYTWQIEGEPQDGQIVFQSRVGKNPTIATWLDSWHMRNDIMLCEATRNQKGIVSLRGSYSFPPGPDWGWRIEIGMNVDGSLVIRMFNISPEGQEALAVLAQYKRIL